MRTNWLANIFNWLGDVFEVLNPSAFKFLAAVLPYSTPIPVAWVTAHSASAYLQFPPWVSFVFVCALEGIGLWFTTLLVDAVVDWIRSKNAQALSVVFMLAVAVFCYIVLLISLNVTLEEASGTSNPTYSLVITLLCFLPLISGIGNGYYKLKLKYETSMAQTVTKREQLEERIRQEAREDRREDRRERLKLKYHSSTINHAPQRELERPQRKPQRPQLPSSPGDEIRKRMDVMYARSRRVLTHSELVSLGFDKSTAWRHRNAWIEEHHIKETR